VVVRNFSDFSQSTREIATVWANPTSFSWGKVVYRSAAHRTRTYNSDTLYFVDIGDDICDCYEVIHLLASDFAVAQFFYRHDETNFIEAIKDVIKPRCVIDCSSGHSIVASHTDNFVSVVHFCFLLRFCRLLE
ncbi:MAG: hypothetical protein J6R74_07205, partial [Tidjanibacter sp.]|nr:hypothetical protein [Tidjanibacter sp.]